MRDPDARRIRVLTSGGDELASMMSEEELLNTLYPGINGTNTLRATLVNSNERRVTIEYDNQPVAEARLEADSSITLNTPTFDYGSITGNSIMASQAFRESLTRVRMLSRGEDYDIDQVRDIENSFNSRLQDLRREAGNLSREDIINHIAEMQLQDEAEENSEH